MVNLNGDFSHKHKHRHTHTKQYHSKCQADKESRGKRRATHKKTMMLQCNKLN